ncbi:OsmC family protein [Marinicella meishanensis]|uniref:OsmC family protein n=1 Tax=Marinicella meishanensis TaxID=2873263 RepID=UPI001CC15E56|nr:OsmC family protein [Marinicella sp. NBU2979]
MSQNSVTTQWVKDYTFVSTNQQNQSIVMDSPTSQDGEAKAPSPMDVVLMGLSACAGIDVKLILSKAKQNFSDIQVQATAQRRQAIPRVYTDINLHFVVTGTDLSAKQVARAIQLSADKYCSVSHMLQASVNITHSHELVAGETP